MMKICKLGRLNLKYFFFLKIQVFITIKYRQSVECKYQTLIISIYKNSIQRIFILVCYAYQTFLHISFSLFLSSSSTPHLEMPAFSLYSNLMKT